MASRRGMGRGLAAILPESGAERPELRELPVEVIRPNPEQPRTNFDPDSIAELAGSIREAGVLQPLIVRPLDDGHYELIAGERRWRAAREAGLAEVPAIVRPGDSAERMKTALVENMAREDLNPVDEARACAALVEDLGMSREEVAALVGRSRPAISNLIRLLELPDEALDLIAAGEISEGHGRAALAASGNDARRRIAADAARHGWSVRETERRASAATGERRRSRVVPHPDQEAMLERAEEAFEKALARGVRARSVRGGIRIELDFDHLDEALEYARSLGGGV